MSWPQRATKRSTPSRTTNALLLSPPGSGSIVTRVFQQESAAIRASSSACSSTRPYSRFHPVRLLALELRAVAGEELAQLLAARPWPRRALSPRRGSAVSAPPSSSTLCRRNPSAISRARKRSTPSASSTRRPARSADSKVSRSTTVTPRVRSADVVRDVARPRDDRQVGKVLADPVGQREAVVDVVDRVDQQPRVGRARRRAAGRAASRRRRRPCSRTCAGCRSARGRDRARSRGCRWRRAGGRRSVRSARSRR